MRDAQGFIIQQFSYDNNPPWPARAAGNGASLEIIDPVGDPSDPANWEVSAADGGTPGGASDADGDGLDADQEATAGTDRNRADTDGDGVNDGQELMLGSNPNVPDQEITGFRITVEAQPNQLLLVWDTFNTVRYEVETSTTLQAGSWQPFRTITATSTSTQLPITTSDPVRFYRVRFAR